MRIRNNPVLGRRPGFTLLEMLIVLGIILVLAALVVAFAPRFQERQRALNGASQLQSWLATARQMAKRDRVPTGIRLLLNNTSNIVWVSDLQYIQQPDDFTAPGSAAISVTGTGPYSVTFSGVDFTGGYTFDNQQLWPVQPGDYVEFQGGGLVHQIPPNPTGGRSTNVTSNTLTLASQPPPITTPVYQYRIIRAPRALQGEALLQMPKNVAIDLLTNYVYGNAMSSINNPYLGVDIMFAPSGEVVGPLAGSDKIILWVRDITQDAGTPGEQTLVTVYCRTGFVATHPVDLTPNPTAPPPLLQPYSFTRDGRSSGM